MALSLSRRRRHRQTIDFLLSAKRDKQAAKRFFRRALGRDNTRNPRTDGSARDFCELYLIEKTWVALGKFRAANVSSFAWPPMTVGRPIQTHGPYPKRHPSFSDALAAVRHRLWTAATFSTSPDHGEVAQIP